MSSSSETTYPVISNLALAKDSSKRLLFGDLPVVPQTRGSNWIHPALVAVNIDRFGLGVITKNDIAKDTLLIVYGGRVITSPEFEMLSEEMQHYPYQISDDLFLTPSSLSDVGLAERVNHSCDPNSGFKGAIHLIAIRDIESGEQISFDYATCVSADDDAFVMKCRCESYRCRNTVTGQDWQLKEIQARLFPYFQPFLQEKIRNKIKGLKKAS